MAIWAYKVDDFCLKSEKWHLYTYPLDPSPLSSTGFKLFFFLHFFLGGGGTQATGQSNKKEPRPTVVKNVLKVDNSLRASRSNSKRAVNGLIGLGVIQARVLRGKVFGTPNRYCPVIFCPDPDRTEK